MANDVLTVCPPASGEAYYVLLHVFYASQSKFVLSPASPEMTSFVIPSGNWQNDASSPMKEAMNVTAGCHLDVAIRF